MTTHRIEFESDGEHLNLAHLMKKCDVLLKDVVVSHKFTVPGGYFEVETDRMSLSGTILYGFVTLRYFVLSVEEQDRFGRKVEPQPPVIIHKGRGLLERLGLGAFLGKQRVVVVENPVIVPAEEESEILSKYCVKWEVLPDKITGFSGLLMLDEKTFDKAIWPRFFDEMKVTIIEQTGTCLSNELLKDIFHPLLKCLYEDWNILLDF